MKNLNMYFAKVFLVIFVVGFISQPISYVMAQEQSANNDTGAVVSSDVAKDGLGEVGTVETDTKSEETTSDDQSQDKPIVDEPSPAEQQPEDVPEPQQQEKTVPEDEPVPPADTSYQIPSTVKQKLPDADVLSGALTFNYPIASPAGRLKLSPQVSLNYNSQNNEEGSILGYGWSLDIPMIERKNVDGLNKIFTSENFTSTFDGDLKKISGGSGLGIFGSKIDNGNFTKYQFINNGAEQYWQLSSKDGIKYTFGQTEESKFSDPNDSTKVFRWYLTKMEDLHGNSVNYLYTKFRDVPAISEISFTNSVATTGIYKLSFGYDDRPDVLKGAKSGFLVNFTKRLSKISLSVQDNERLRYTLVYQQNLVNKRSELTSVKLEGIDEGNVVLDGGTTSFEYNSMSATALLTQITQPSGGTIKVSYTSSAQLKDDAGELQNPNLPFSVYVVTKLEYNDRHGTTWENSLGYSGGWYYYNGPMDRRFVGFEKVTRTDNAGNTVTTYYHQGNGANVGFSEPADDWSKAGKIYKTELRDSQGFLYNLNLYDWQFVVLSSTSGNERSFVKLVSSVAETFDGNTSHKSRAVSYNYNNETGNLVSITDWGEVNSNSSLQFTDTKEDKVSVQLNYAISSSHPELTGFESKRVVTNFSGQKVKETKTYYDGLLLNQVEIGNQTKQEMWISGQVYSTTNWTYSPSGQVLTETNPIGSTTVYTYDQFDLFPITQTNALGQATSFEYDYLSGQVTKTTDPNGGVVQKNYDQLGRVLSELYSRPDNPTELFTKVEYEYSFYDYSGSVGGSKMVQKNFLGSYNEENPPVNLSVSYTDGFERTLQTKLQVEPETGSTIERFVTNDVRYNNIGQIEASSLPYYTNSSDLSERTTDVSLWTTMEYDAAYRVTKITNSVGFATNNYNDWKVTSTDADGKVKEVYSDAFGHVDRVDEHNNSETYTTKYEYDALGNLAKITDAQNNVRAILYDGLSRRTSLEDLHDPSDSTFGVWQFTYDDAGNLKRRQDPNGLALKLNYDVLSRIRNKTITGQVDAVEIYEYDNCTNGIGRLCNVVTNEVVEHSSYDRLGQVVSSEKIISGQSYVTGFEYNRQGQQTRVVNPDSSEVKYSYNIGNAVEQVAKKDSSSSNDEIVVNNIDYAPTGVVAKLVYQSGAQVVSTYDSAQLYRLSSKVSTVPLAAGGVKTIQNLSYQYDPVGNITRVVDMSELNTRKTMEYFYDDLHRLVLARSSHAVGGNNYIQSYEYDTVGNILFKSDVGTYSYEGNEGSSYANPHAVTKIVKDGNVIEYDYDKNGNVISFGEPQSSENTTLEWDYENRLKVLTKNGVIPNEFSYEYSSDNIRVKSSGFSGTTYYPTGFYNTDGTTAQKHILAWDMTVATIKTAGGVSELTQLFTDHLGSVVVSVIPGTSPENGGIAEILDYYPFGEIKFDSVSNGTTEQRKYIGKEFDTETGLSYLDARYYDSHIGRFLSQDAVFLAVGFDITDPQGMNSYSYARNNPIRMIDPSGMWFKEAMKAFGAYAAGVVRGAVVGTISSAAMMIGSIATMVAHPIYAAKTIYSEVTRVADSVKAISSSPQYRQAVKEKGMQVLDRYFDQSVYDQANQLGYMVGEAGVMFYVGQNPNLGSVRSFVFEDATVLNKVGKPIYTGSVDLIESVKAIESGSLQPRYGLNGKLKYYANKEGHVELDYSGGNQYLEYGVINSGAPANNSERILRGTVKGDMFYSSDHYKNLKLISK